MESSNKDEVAVSTISLQCDSGKQEWVDPYLSSLDRQISIIAYFAMIVSM